MLRIMFIFVLAVVSAVACNRKFTSEDSSDALQALALEKDAFGLMSARCGACHHESDAADTKNRWFLHTDIMISTGLVTPGRNPELSKIYNIATGKDYVHPIARIPKENLPVLEAWILSLPQSGTGPNPGDPNGGTPSSSTTTTSTTTTSTTTTIPPKILVEITMPRAMLSDLYPGYIVENCRITFDETVLLDNTNPWPTRLTGTVENHLVLSVTNVGTTHRLNLFNYISSSSLMNSTVNGKVATGTVGTTALEVRVVQAPVTQISCTFTRATSP